ncbi:MAG TPA: ATP-binding protein [Terriglobales bacterium]|nr:ATP-binding protein [Terriglobales bacterium]
MKSLFLKIFLSFWLAQALIVALVVIATVVFRPQTESPFWEYIKEHTAQQLVDAYETGGAPVLDKQIDQLSTTFKFQAFLFDDQGRELAGRTVPAWAHRLSSGLEPQTIGWAQRFSSRRFVTHGIAAADGHRYVMVAEIPPRPWLPLLRQKPPGTGLFVLALAVLVSGIVCYLLARYLTSDVGRLRAATQQLAAGDLSARAEAPPGRRRDEIAQLVRDFNTMAQRLQDLVNAQSRLLNDISHELRSPLARLSVALGLAWQRTGPDAHSVLERMELEANRLNELIGRLLTLARLEGGEDAVGRTPIALEELVLDIGKDADFEAQSRQCRVRCVIQDDATVLGSPSLLHSAVENVVRNAMRHTPERTEVEIRLARESRGGKDEAVVRVTDRGPGVPQESLDKLFRPFYRLDDARGRQTGGVGLGLAITERAVRLHGGTVRAANRPEGGLMVEIRLPLDFELTAEVSAKSPERTAVQPS